MKKRLNKLEKTIKSNENDCYISVIIHASGESRPEKFLDNKNIHPDRAIVFLPDNKRSPEITKIIEIILMNWMFSYKVFLCRSKIHANTLVWSPPQIKV